ncbi:MAG: hypothetical protein ABSG25_07910 [Bryobacteraceae bacterium]
MLLFADFTGFSVVRRGVDSPVQTVVVEHVQPRLQPVQFLLLPPEFLLPRGLLREVRRHKFRLQPGQYDGRNDERAQAIRELLFESLFARVRLRAFPPVTGAVVIHVAPLLHLADKRAPAVPATHQAAERETMMHLPMSLFVPPVQDLLHALPNVARYQRLVAAVVGDAAVFEFASVDALAQDLVQRRDRDFARALAEAKPFFPSLPRQRFQAVLAGCKPTEQVCHDGTEHRVGHDDTLAV